MVARALAPSLYTYPAICRAGNRAVFCVILRSRRRFKIKICINGGHYPGIDPGAVGSRALEAEITRALMNLVADHLRAAGYAVLAVQSNSLREICDAANTWGANLFASIHCNAAKTKAARGTETYCYTPDGEGALFAYLVQRQITASLGTADRGVKCADFYVLRETRCPAVLVEAAFISNAADEALLLDRQEDFARAIARGISDYYA